MIYESIEKGRQVKVKCNGHRNGYNFGDILNSIEKKKKLNQIRICELVILVTSIQYKYMEIIT